MNHRLRVMVFAAVACSAINGVATTGGAFAQFTLDMAEQTPAKQQDSKAPDPSTKPLSAPLLQGGTVEQSSPLWILQRKGQSSQFDAELRRRTPMMDPSRYQKLQAEFDRTPSLQGELHDTNWMLPPSLTPMNPLFAPSLMPTNPLLQGSLVTPERIDLPGWSLQQPLWDPNLPTEPTPIRGVRSPSLSPPKAAQISDEIELQLLRSHRSIEPGFQRPIPINPRMGRQFDMPAGNYGPNAASSEIEASLRKSTAYSTSEIDGQLLRSKGRQAIPDIDGLIRAQQAVAKPMLDKQSAIASTQIKAVFRRMEQPSVDLETDARFFLGKDSESLISWDAWYARVARLSEPLLVRAVEGAHGPEGANTVSITVQANHHLSVSLIDGGNPAFNAAIMRAYRGLDGNPALAFPAGSRRTKVTFLVDSNHIAPGDVSGVSTQSCKGDTERPRHR